MKFIIKEDILLDATTEWTARMGEITPEEYAEQLDAQVVTVPEQYTKHISLSCFSRSSSGVYSFSSQLYNDVVNSKKMDYIRRKRRFECFSYINRGQLWYNTLSQTEMEELQSWYNAWLDLPNRPDLNIDAPQYPDAPSFLTDFVPYESALPEQAFN